MSEGWPQCRLPSRIDPGCRDQRARGRGPGPPAAPHLTLNDDGQRHPMENSLSLFTVVAGIVACVLGFLAYQNVPGPGRTSGRRGSD